MSVCWLACLFAFAAWTLAQQSPVPEIGNLTATAILGWYAWHTASRTIPGLVRAFRDEMAAERADCRSAREALHQELAAERALRHADRLAIVAAVDELAERLPHA